MLLAAIPRVTARLRYTLRVSEIPYVELPTSVLVLNLVGAYEWLKNVLWRWSGGDPGMSSPGSPAGLGTLLAWRVIVLAGAACYHRTVGLVDDETLASSGQTAWSDLIPRFAEAVLFRHDIP